MPELPDIELYVHALRARTTDQALNAVRIGNPFLLRSVEPPLADIIGRRVRSVERIGKRIALGLEGDFWLIVHLMIAGRFHWSDTPPALTAKARLAAFDFDSGSLLLTENAGKKRASLHAAQGVADKESHRPPGIEPLECSEEDFIARLDSENRTLKRILTDPRHFSGIGNAYSDEILHAARLSPATLTSRLTDEQKRTLYKAARDTLIRWRERLLEECGDGFPRKVTAFRPGMAVHGRYGKPCPDCGRPVQRIRYQSRETNYCAGCQTGGKVLADRSLSRLLKDRWPDSIDGA